ncbi:MAG: hypothetical protein N3F66_08875 [Spirochaetes bacterium]|nr:hypothetical protein [Spirochaetota bacterium]
MVSSLRIIICILFLLLPLVFLLSSCASKKPATPIPPTNTTGREELLFEYEKEGFIDNNTFRVVVILPAEEQYNELSAQQKGQERAYVSLKNYITTQNKVFDSKIHNYLLTIISSYGSIKKRNSSCSTRYCYYYDITKNGLKAEIDALGK